MRRMIPENQQEALRKLTSKEAILSLIEIGNTEGIGFCALNIDSDNETYLHISGNAELSEGDGTEFIEIENAPIGLESIAKFPATNSEGGGGYVTVEYVNATLYPKRIRISFNAGAMDRTVYFSAYLSKLLLVM